MFSSSDIPGIHSAWWIQRAADKKEQRETQNRADTAEEWRLTLAGLSMGLGGELEREKKDLIVLAVAVLIVLIFLTYALVKLGANV